MDNKINRISEFANQIRLNTLKQLNHLGFGHYGGSMSIVELLAVLYGEVMHIDPKNPDDPSRDYFILSKGHAGPALYSTLALKGYFPIDNLLTLNQNGTTLPSHPDRLLTIGVDATTGSLGQGISIAAGIALSLQLDGKTNRVFTVVGDGELNEGQCWEAIQFIAHHQLQNLVLIIDYNKKQLDGNVEDIINPFSFVEKLNAFGFRAVSIKGDDIAHLLESLTEIESNATKRPLAIILDSQKGQGVEYLTSLENNHHLRLDEHSKVALQQAVIDLEVAK